MTVDFPARYQREELESELARSGLDPKMFTWDRPPDIYGNVGRDIHGLRIRHKTYTGAVFEVRWQPPHRTFPGRGKVKGEYHVDLSPGVENPREEHPYVPWEEVVSRMGQWTVSLAREFRARGDESAFVKLPIALGPVVVAGESYIEADVERATRFLEAAEEEIVEVIEEELATREDLDEVREWMKGELADLRAELKLRSRRRFQRQVTWIAAQVTMKVGPQVWERIWPILKEAWRLVESLPELPP